MPCQECRKYFNKKQESLLHLQNKHFIKFYMSCLWLQFQDKMLHKKTFTNKVPDNFWIHVQHFNISDIFNKIQNLNKIKIKVVVPFLPTYLQLQSPLISYHSFALLS